MPEVRLIDANSLKHSRGIAGDEILHEIIDNQPTIEAEPVRHGRWIEAEDDNGKDGIVCSECGHFVPFDYEYFDNPSHLKQDNKICNNCGAIMKNGGAENG